MTSGTSSHDATTSPEFSAMDHYESREEGGSTEPLASSTVYALEVPSIEVGNHADDDFDLSSREGDDGTASVASGTISARTYECGRPYMVVDDGRYPIPSDELEQNREDMKHAILMTAHLTSLDLFEYPSAKVRGIDIAPIQPKWVPAYATFLVDDCEQDWIERDVDLAHFRFTIATLKNTSQVLRHASKSLRPGGWIELQELLPTALCDDGTMPNDDPVKYLYEKIERAFEKFGMSAQLPAELEPFLHEAGFENIHCQSFKVPIGSWAKDRAMRIVGLYQKMAVVDVLPIFSGPFRALGMSEAEIEVMNAMARKSLDDPKVHRYFNYYFWYAQKPRLSQAEQDIV
ncbi:hypothetical protein E4U30_003975 [Claviceps sp. LM220 group G6]|nr:hypothetical protein E4U30_003975 [Claviceps sp. LM220 group G6]